MPDQFPPEVRKLIMARVRGKDTRPELLVRRALHRAGYRYRLHYPALPGKPDLAFPSRRKVVFVNGCFWHSHCGCSRARIPETNREYWTTKLQRNRQRDAKNLAELKDCGWEAITLWECELKNLDSTVARVIDFLGPAGNASGGNMMVGDRRSRAESVFP